MELNKELELKIELVKKAVKDAGGSITQEDMSKRLGRSRTYLSQLKKGHENVSPQFMAFFNETFAAFLPKGEEVTMGHIKALQSSIDVILNEIAKLKKDVYKDDMQKDRDAKVYLSELLQEIELSKVGR